MKRPLFSTLLFAAVTSAAQAQISKGTALFGGNFGYSNSTSKSTSTLQALPIGGVPINSTSIGQRTDETTNRTASVNPSGGLFVADNLAVGLTGGFGSHKSTSPYYDSWQSFLIVRKQVSESATFVVAPFLRYYYLPVENFGLYGQLSAGYQRQWSTLEVDVPNYSTQENKSNGAFVTVTPALVFFPTNKLGLELTMGSIGYTNTRSKPENLQSNQYGKETKTSSFGASFGLSSLTLGASFYVGRQ